jgi:Spy/CpxP family protein refolding chaperone
MKSTAARNVIAAAVVALALALTASTASAQEKPADNMQILAEKVKADKKLVVADNMGLTESEAKAFWPVYDAYQKDLAQLNDRLSKLIETYAGYYNNKTLTDANAKELTAEAMAIETAELDLKKSYLPKLYSVLPAVKVARYIQIENKIRAIVKLQIAAAVPLAP